MENNEILNKIENLAQRLVNLTGKNRLLKFPKNGINLNFEYSIPEFEENFLKNDFEDLEIIFNHKKLDEAINLIEELKKFEEENNNLKQVENFRKIIYEKIQKLDLPKIKSPKVENIKAVLAKLKLESKKKLEEKGLKTLFLSFGTVTWNESSGLNGSSKHFDSPLILFPVEIEIDKKTKQTKIAPDLSERGIIFNPILEIYLNKQLNNEKLFKIDENISISLNLNQVKEIISDTLKSENLKFEFTEEIRITEYSFPSQFMYEELLYRKNYISENDIISSILEGKDLTLGNSSQDIYERDLVKKVYENDLNVLNSDITQDMSIYKSLNQKVSIIQGPPGTGKSQTIVNLISNIVGSGKTVLFVCEKRAALEVVYNRLKKVNLDNLCLPLFKTINSKKEFYNEIFDKYTKIKKSKHTLNHSEKLNRKIISQRLHDYSDVLSSLEIISGKPIYELLSQKAFLRNKVKNYIEWDNSIKIKNIDDFNYLSKFLEDYPKYLENISLEDYKKLSYINKKNLSIPEEIKIKNKLKEINENLNFLSQEKFINKLNNFETINELLESSKDINLESFKFVEEFKKTDQTINYINTLKEILEENYSFTKYPHQTPLLSINLAETKYKTIELLKNAKINQELKSIYKVFEYELNQFNSLYKSINSDTNVNIEIDINKFLNFINLFKYIDKDFDLNKVINDEKLNDFKTLIDKYRSNNDFFANKKQDLKSNYGFDTEKIPEFISQILGQIKNFNLIKFLSNKKYRSEIRYVKNETNITNAGIIFGKFDNFLLEYEIIQNLESSIKNQENSIINEFENKYGIRLPINKVNGLLLEIYNESKYKELPIEIHNYILNYGGSALELHNLLNSYLKICEFIETSLKLNIRNNFILIEGFYKYLNSENELFKNFTQIITNSENELDSFLSSNMNIEEFINIYNSCISLKDKILDAKTSENKFVLIKEDFPEFIKFVNSFYYFSKLSNISENKEESLLFIKNLVQTLNFNNNDIRNEYSKLDNNINNLRELLDIQINLLTKNDIFSLQKNLKFLFENILFLHDICRINLEREDFISKLSSIMFIDKSLEIISNISELKDSVLLSYLDYITNNTLNSVQHTFSDVNRHKINIDEFKKSENEIIKSNPDYILETIKQKISSPSLQLFSISATEIEANKQKKHASIRKFLQEKGMNLLNVAPCWLASPSNIANYSPIGSCTFDYIIFDEASQIKVEQAIGAIARGHNLVVIGDSKQMPPTDFFEVKDNDEEYDDDNEETRFESILDSVNSVFSKMSTMLKYHYRSKYPELIEFSNVKMYNSELITFPSNTINPKPIEFVYVSDGIFDGNRKEGDSKIQGKRCNENEARMVAEKCYQIVREYPTKSLGVVTFNQKQEEEIRNMIEELAKQSEDYSQLRDKLDEQTDNYENFFIKNLETVQGDERDIILISVTYGKNKSGKVTQRFGPITSYNGKRRLNVAISRAKEKMVIFSSLKYNDINVNDKESPNIFFQQFLEFAEKGPDVLFASKIVENGKEQQFDSPFEEQVWEELTNLGYKVDTQIGSLGFRVDLAIQNPNGSNYILGIECDGRAYHSSYNAKTNDRVRQEILENAGWEIFRIYSLDWFNNKEQVLQNINKRVNYIQEKKDII